MDTFNVSAARAAINGECAISPAAGAAVFATIRAAVTAHYAECGLSAEQAQTDASALIVAIFEDIPGYVLERAGWTTNAAGVYEVPALDTITDAQLADIRAICDDAEDATDAEINARLTAAYPEVSRLTSAEFDAIQCSTTTDRAQLARIAATYAADEAQDAAEDCSSYAGAPDKTTETENARYDAWAKTLPEPAPSNYDPQPDPIDAEDAAVIEAWVNAYRAEQSDAKAQLFTTAETIAQTRGLDDAAARRLQSDAIRQLMTEDAAAEESANLNRIRAEAQADRDHIAGIDEAISQHERELMSEGPTAPQWKRDQRTCLQATRARVLDRLNDRRNAIQDAYHARMKPAQDAADAGGAEERAALVLVAIAAAAECDRRMRAFHNEPEPRACLNCGQPHTTTDLDGMPASFCAECWEEIAGDAPTPEFTSDPADVIAIHWPIRYEEIAETAADGEPTDRQHFTEERAERLSYYLDIRARSEYPNAHEFEIAQTDAFSARAETRSGKIYEPFFDDMECFTAEALDDVNAEFPANEPPVYARPTYTVPVGDQDYWIVIEHGQPASNDREFTAPDLAINAYYAETERGYPIAFYSESAAGWVCPECARSDYDNANNTIFERQLTTGADRISCDCCGKSINPPEAELTAAAEEIATFRQAWAAFIRAGWIAAQTWTPAVETAINHDRYSRSFAASFDDALYNAADLFTADDAE